MSKQKDIFGRTINAGDFFAYAMRRGNSSEIAVGVVLEAGDGLTVWNVKESWGEVQPNTRASFIGGGGNLVKLPEASVPEKWHTFLCGKYAEFLTSRP